MGTFSTEEKHFQRILGWFYFGKWKQGTNPFPDPYLTAIYLIKNMVSTPYSTLSTNWLTFVVRMSLILNDLPTNSNNKLLNVKLFFFKNNLLKVWKWTQTNVWPKTTQNIVNTRIPCKHDKLSLVCGLNNLVRFLFMENISTKKRFICCKIWINYDQDTMVTRLN